MSKILTNYYTENYKDLCNLIRRRKLFNSGDHEDVVQTAFMKALQFIASFNEEKQIDKWFLTILNNCYKDYYRSESLKGAAYEEFNEEDFPVEDRSLLVDDEALRKLNLFIQSKAEPMRTILNLYYLRGYAPRDIVYLVNKWNYNSIRALVSSAGKEFKDILRI